MYSLSRSNQQRGGVAGMVMCLAAMILGSVGSGVCLGGIEGDLELLRLVVRAHEANRALIQTWRGNARIESWRNDAEGPRTRLVSEAEFVLDTSVGAKRWSWEVLEAHQRKDGALVVNPDDGGTYTDEMVKPDGYYRYARGFKPTGSDEWQRTMVILPAERAEEKVQGTSRSFDPMWYMSDRGRPIVRRLMFLYENADHEKVQGRVYREDDRVVVELGGGQGINRHTFDLSKGGNLVAFEGRDPYVTWETSYEYVKEKGVWVPSRYERKAAWGDEEAHRRVVFERNMLNEPVPQEEFTMAAMGIEQGARVSDNRLDLFYEYQNELEADEVALALDEAGQPVEATVGAASPAAADAPAEENDVAHDGSTGDDGPSRPAVSATPAGAVASNGFDWRYLAAGLGLLAVIALVVAAQVRSRRRKVQEKMAWP